MKELERNVKAQADFACSLEYCDIPDAVRKRARDVLLDSIGCICKGLKGNRCVPERNEERLLKLTSAMVSTELYEGNRKAVGHPACHILPAMLCEEQSISVGEFIRIFTAAYETAARWGSAVRFPQDILGHGTVLASGAAVAYGLLNGACADELYEALLITCSLPEVSVWQSVWDGSGLHDIYPALAACKARNAYWLVSQGIRSSGKIIEEVCGKIMKAGIEPGLLSKGLGEKYLILSNYYKVHTGCRFIHPFADVIQSRLESGLDKSDISSVDIYTYKKAARLTAQQVPNRLAGQFSIPVAIAVQLEKGKLSPDTMECCTDDPSVLSWKGRITLHEDERYNRLLPDIRGGRVEIHLNSGETETEEVFHAKGDFDNPDPFTRDDLKCKFRENAAEILSGPEISELEKIILEGEEDDPFPQVFRSREV